MVSHLSNLKDHTVPKVPVHDGFGKRIFQSIAAIPGAYLGMPALPVPDYSTHRMQHGV